MQDDLKNIQDIPTDQLKLMIELCPGNKDGLVSVAFSCGGKTVTLTKESRWRGIAELKRRQREGIV